MIFAWASSIATHTVDWIQGKDNSRPGIESGTGYAAMRCSRRLAVKSLRSSMFHFPLMLLLLLTQTPEAVPPELRIDAPPGMAAQKSRMESLDPMRLADVVRLVGLKDPGAPISIRLAESSSDLARSVPPWIAGFAQNENVVIFPSRSPSYPHSTLDDVVRHEVAHVLIWRASSGRPVPRWFNEGLAMAAERRRELRDQTQLFLQLASGSRLSFEDIDRLFNGGQAEQTRAYLLSGTLVWDLLKEHGESAGGRILEEIGRGSSFETAFRNVTGKSTTAAEAEFWKRQRVWTTWLPILFSQETLWMAITLLTFFAIWRVRKRSTEIRRRWEEEDNDEDKSG